MDIWPGAWRLACIWPTKHDAMIVYGYVISIAEFELRQVLWTSSEIFHKVRWLSFDYIVYKNVLWWL